MNTNFYEDAMAAAILAAGSGNGWLRGTDSAGHHKFMLAYAPAEYKLAKENERQFKLSLLGTKYEGAF